MKQEIHVDIGTDGSLRVEAHGYAGPACLKATEAIERALGKVKVRRPKAALHRLQAAARARLGRGGTP